MLRVVQQQLMVKFGRLPILVNAPTLRNKESNDEGIEMGTDTPPKATKEHLGSVIFLNRSKNYQQQKYSIKFFRVRATKLLFCEPFSQWMRYNSNCTSNQESWKND